MDIELNGHESYIFCDDGVEIEDVSCIFCKIRTKAKSNTGKKEVESEKRMKAISRDLVKFIERNYQMHDIERVSESCGTCHAYFNRAYNKYLLDNPRTVQEVMDSKIERANEKKRKLNNNEPKSPRTTKPQNSTNEIARDDYDLPTEKVKAGEAKVRELVAKLVSKRHISIKQVIPTVNDVIGTFEVGAPVVASSESICRMICEGAVCLDLELIQLVNESTDLGWSCDETPNQRAGRSFFEISIFGLHRRTRKQWEEVYKVAELIGEGSKTAAKLTNHLVEARNELALLAEAANLSFPSLHEIHLLCLDNTATNVSEKNGIKGLYHEKREADYKEKKPSTKFLPTIVSGCVDHQAALFGKRFSAKLHEYLKSIKRTDLIHNGKLVAYKLLKILSIYLGVGAPHRGPQFEGHCKELGIEKKVFHYISKNRYCSYELQAHKIMQEKNYHAILSFIEIENGVEEGIFTSEYRAYFLDPDVQFIFVSLEYR
jgi:hypothetical protein